MAFDATDFQVTTLPDPLSLTTPRERLEYMRDFLRTLPAGLFDMNYWAATRDGDPVPRERFLHLCGTAGCIGGWSMALFDVRSNLHNAGHAGDLLGLNSSEASALFYPAGDMADGVSGYSATPDDAADVLDHLIRTGEVDWSVARKAEA